MQAATFQGDVWVNGQLTASTMIIAAASVGDPQVRAFPGPGLAVAASKLQQQRSVRYAQSSTAAAAADRQLIRRVNGISGVVISFYAGAITPAVGADTCTVDLLKNGISILSAPVSITSALAAYGSVLGALAATGLVVGDLLEAKITPNHTSGTLPLGIWAQLLFAEDPQ